MLQRTAYRRFRLAGIPGEYVPPEPPAPLTQGHVVAYVDGSTRHLFTTDGRIVTYIVRR